MKGHKATVLLVGFQESFTDHGVDVVGCRPRTLAKLGWLQVRWEVKARIDGLVRRGLADLVEAPDWCGLTAGIRLKVPVVVRCHGSETYFCKVLGKQPKAGTRIAEMAALRTCASAAAVSEYTAEITRSLFRLTTKPRVIYNGVDTDYFVPGQRRDGSQHTILYVGTLVRKKGVLDVARVFSRLCRRRHDLTLKVIGRDSRDKASGAGSMLGLMQGEMSEEARRRFLYLGEMPPEKIRDELQQAAVCVFPSYAEALPISWLEAMACGRPVVAYDIGWAREVIDSGRDGVLVPAGDVEGLETSLLSMIENPRRRVEFGEAARAKAVGKFGIKRMVNETLRWYGDVSSKQWSARADAAGRNRDSECA
jgi:starch synthase